MRGTGDWVDDQMPETWRQKILMLFPNGDSPLTAIMSMLGTETTTSPIIHWWEKEWANQSGDVINTWNDAALTIPYAGGGAAGQTLYFRISAADVTKYVVSDIVFLRVSSDLTVDVRGKVIMTTGAGANSYLSVMLLEADDNSDIANSDLRNCDVAWIIGSAHAEGSGSPDSWMLDPEPLFNYLQIFKDAFEHTETAKRTTLRTGDQVAQARKDTLEAHGKKLEKAFIFGLRTQRNGSNNKPERTLGGVKSYLSTNVGDYSTDPRFAGQSWATGGEDWFDATLEQIFDWGKDERLILCGAGALGAIQRLVKARGTVELTRQTKSYGISVQTYETVFGTVHFKRHPLFTQQATTRYSMFVVEPQNLKTVISRDTKYQQNIQDNDADAQKDQYIAEMSLEVHLEKTHGWFDNVGIDNVL